MCDIHISDSEICEQRHAGISLKVTLITVQRPVEHIALKKYFGDFPHCAVKKVKKYT
jgi:hypothetical protein